MRKIWSVATIAFILAIIGYACMVLASGLFGVGEYIASIPLGLIGIGLRLSSDIVGKQEYQQTRCRQKTLS